MKHWSWAVFALIVVAGCSEKKAPLMGEDLNLDARTKRVERPPLPGGITPPPVEPTPEIQPTAPSGRVTEQGVESRGKFEIIKPGQPGWKQTPLTIAQIGAKVDTAMMGLKGAFAEGRFDIKTKEMSGYQSIKSIFQDANHYRFEFVDPTAPSAGNYIIRNGTRLGFMQRNSWVGEKFPTLPAETLKILHLVPAFGIQPFITRKPFWAPFLARLQKEGFKITQETKSLPLPNKEQRDFHRILASKADVTAEFVIDGKRFVPVTVRVNQKISAKESVFSQWSPGWSWNRPIPKESFDLPANVK
ncbi:MAG: hypothetical protein JNJ45_07400 [Chthonomonas sp.]|nr:hypothetical protein [Chthonomonas sp.]